MRHAIDMLLAATAAWDRSPTDANREHMNACERLVREARATEAARQEITYRRR